MNKRHICFLLAGALMFLIPACENDPDTVFDDADQYVKYGEAALKKKNPDLKQAVQQFENALKVDPDHFDALIGLGDALMYRALSIRYSEQRQNEGGPGGNSSSPSGRNRPSDSRKITLLMKRAWRSYQEARRVRPDSPVPYFHMGRFVFEFKDRAPEDLKRGIRKLEEARKRANPEDYPYVTGQILYYMGGSKFYYELQKPPEKRDFSEASTFMKKYLDYYSKRGQKPPLESSIEKLLMRIDRVQEQQNESRSNPATRDDESASG